MGRKGIPPGRREFQRPGSKPSRLFKPAGTRIRSGKQASSPESPRARLQECLPSFVVEGLREALPVFNRKMPGFCSPDAVLDRGGDADLFSPCASCAEEDLQSRDPSGTLPLRRRIRICRRHRQLGAGRDQGGGSNSEQHEIGPRAQGIG